MAKRTSHSLDHQNPTSESAFGTSVLDLPGHSLPRYFFTASYAPYFAHLDPSVDAYRRLKPFAAGNPRSHTPISGPDLAFRLLKPSSTLRRMSSHVIQSHSLLSEACSRPSCSRRRQFHQASNATLDHVEKEESPCSARLKSDSDFGRANTSV
jgi:hypothetical protein